MISTKKDFHDIATSASLTYQQKLYNLANTAERLFDPVELLGYEKKDLEYIEKGMLCDLNEGYLIYRPRYIVPDYSVYIEKGCRFLDLPRPESLDDVLDGLLILYAHIPSITSFPVFIGFLDALIDPFIKEEDPDELVYPKIKRFLNHIDKTIPDSFCHADIGPAATRAGYLILKAIVELKNPTPNMSLMYDPEITEEDFALECVNACLRVSKPSFSNVRYYNQDIGSHALCSCYNALPHGGGAYCLLRFRLGTIAKQVRSLEDMLDKLVDLTHSLLRMTDKRIEFLVEKSHFFESSFLVKEGFIDKDNFTSMIAIVGLSDGVNEILRKENINETFGSSKRGDEIGHAIMGKIQEIVSRHEGRYCKRTNNRYLLHAQVGASILEEDKDNTPAHRVRVGEEPVLPLHLNHASSFHKYFPSGTGDLFAFDQTSLEYKEAVLDIIKGAFASGMRYITTYLKDTDLIRVTGYLVKKSEVEKANRDEAVLRDTTWFGKGTQDNAHVFERRRRFGDSGQ